MKRKFFQSVAFRMMATTAVFMLIFVTSCQKDDSIITSPGTSIPIKDVSLSYQVNASTAGTLHNECLTEIANNIADPAQIGNINYFNEQSDIVAAFYANNNLAFPASINQQMVADHINQIKNNTLFSNMKSDGVISAAVENELNALVSILQSASTHAGATQELNNFKEHVLNTASFSDDEKDLLVGSANVAISTGEFWETAYDNAGSLWHNASIPGQGQPVYAGKVKWWKLLGDVAGFAAGFGLGGVAGGAALGGMISACIE